MKNIKISDETHILLKKYCNENHIKIGEYIDHIIRDIHKITKYTIKNITMNNINEIVRKWKTTRLLEELTSVQAVDCAILLEELTQLLIQNEKNKPPTISKINVQQIAGTLLPIARRLFNEHLSLKPSAQFLYDDYVKFFVKTNPLVEDIIDPEAKLCEMYVKDLVSRLNNK
jgi:hypothetical protein